MKCIQKQNSNQLKDRIKKIDMNFKKQMKHIGESKNPNQGI